jgi:hypothetical protein
MLSDSQQWRCIAQQRNLDFADASADRVIGTTHALKKMSLTELLAPVGENWLFSAEMSAKTT